MSSYSALYRQTRLPSVCISIFLHHPALPSAGAKLRLSASHQPRTNTHSNAKVLVPKSNVTPASKIGASRHHHHMESRLSYNQLPARDTAWKCTSAALPVWRLGNANIPVLCDTRTSHPLTCLALHKRTGARTREYFLPAPKRRPHPQPSHLITLY